MSRPYDESRASPYLAMTIRAAAAMHFDRVTRARELLRSKSKKG